MSVGNIKQKFAQFRTKLSSFGWKIINDWSFSLAALIAYNLLISLLPLILCLFSATYLLFGHDQYFINATRDRLTESFPQQNFDDIVISLSTSISQQAISVFIVSFIVAIFAGSRLFIGIDDVLTLIYRIRERTILKQNIHAIKMLLVFITLLPIVIIGSSVLALLKTNEKFYMFLTIVLSGIIVFILFNLIYYFVPKRDMNWSKIWCGSLCAAISIIIVFFVFPLYVHRFMGDYIGQIGFIIITLILFYVFGLILVIGAQINAFFFDNIQPLSDSLGNAINSCGDQENLSLINRSHSMLTLADEFNPSN